MTSRVMSVQQAYRALGLEPGAGLAAARSAFRTLVKTLHPDVAPPTPQTLARLAEIVAAMDSLKASAPVCLEVEIASDEAAAGLTRTLRFGDRPILVRIPAGTADGERIAAVGEPDISITVRIFARTAGRQEETSDPFFSDGLDAFIHEYSRPSAHARLARWIRQAQSAA